MIYSKYVSSNINNLNAAINEEIINYLLYLRTYRGYPKYFTPTSSIPN